MREEREVHNIALGRAVRQLRKEAGVTQKVLSERAGISVRVLRRIEAGGVDADWGTIRHIAYGMGVSLTEVFRLTEQLERRPSQ